MWVWALESSDLCVRCGLLGHVLKEGGELTWKARDVDRVFTRCLGLTLGSFDGGNVGVSVVFGELIHAN